MRAMVAPRPSVLTRFAAVACSTDDAGSDLFVPDADAGQRVVDSGVKELSIEAVVRAMRHQRHPWMVEGHHQYQFAYVAAIAEISDRVAELE